MRVTDAQVRKLMTEYDRHGRVEKAGLAAGMSRNTATKYVKAKKLPSELNESRSWRTRPNPFEKDWVDIVQLLEVLPRGAHFRTGRIKLGELSRLLCQNRPKN